SISISRLSPISTLFPYTTLFRSQHCFGDAANLNQAFVPQMQWKARDLWQPFAEMHRRDFKFLLSGARTPNIRRRLTNVGGDITRSEEHTSELQSRENLVCRLLLE